MKKNSKKDIIHSADSKRNHLKAWKHFESLGKVRKGMVLHHTDVNMISEDPDRYAQWNVEDLQPMTKVEHRSLHMALTNRKGQRFTMRHRRAISKGMKTQIKGKLIRIHRPAVAEDIKVFKTMAEAAKYIGCTKQLVSQCLSDRQNNRKAYGYSVEVVD